MTENDNKFNDAGLSELLSRWQTPEVSSKLDARIIASFRAFSKPEEVLPSHARGSRVPSKLFEVNTMKKCPGCNESFSDKFVFCPIDGVTLMIEEVEPQLSFEVGSNESMVVASSGVYHVTMMNDIGLVRRLAREIKSIAQQSRLTFPEFKKDPVGFAKRGVDATGMAFQRFISAPNVAVALMVAFMFLLTTVSAVALFDRYSSSLTAQNNEKEELELQQMVEIPDAEKELEKGNAGTAKGDGGGSKPNKEKPGGGGGQDNQKPAQNGKLPTATLDAPQIIPPTLDPPVVKNPSLPVPATISVDPALVEPDPRNVQYGDPNSKSTDPSLGDRKGTGIGDGEGEGYKDGKDKNTGGKDFKQGGSGPGGDGGGGDIDVNKTFRINEVTQKAKITFNPQPEYTEEARKNQVQGVVRVSAVLTASGGIINVRAIGGLPHGLTEKALEAARRIKFVPAQKDGRNVSQYVTLEYNFRIY